MERDDYLSARTFKSQGNYALAHEYYQKAIQSGDYKGHYGLVVFAEETGEAPTTLVPKYTECFVPIKNMALNGDPEAASIIGVYYAIGLGEIKGNIHSSND